MNNKDWFDLIWKHAHLLWQELPVPGDLGAPTQTLGLQEGKDVEGEEPGQDGGEVQVLHGDALSEPVLDKLVLRASALTEHDVQEAFALGVCPQVKLKGGETKLMNEIK